MGGCCLTSTLEDVVSSSCAMPGHILEHKYPFCVFYGKEILNRKQSGRAPILPRNVWEEYHSHPSLFCETAHAILWDPKYSVCGEESWTFCCRSPITTSLHVLHTRKLFTSSNKLVCFSIGSPGWRKFGIYLNGSSHVINDVTHYSCVNIKCGVVDVN